MKFSCKPQFILHKMQFSSARLRNLYICTRGITFLAHPVEEPTAYTCVCKCYQKDMNKVYEKPVYV